MDFRYSHEGCITQGGRSQVSWRGLRKLPLRSTVVVEAFILIAYLVTCHTVKGAWARKSFFAQEPCSAVLAAMDRLSHFLRFFTVTRQFILISGLPGCCCSLFHSRCFLVPSLSLAFSAVLEYSTTVILVFLVAAERALLLKSSSCSISLLSCVVSPFYERPFSC